MSEQSEDTRVRILKCIAEHTAVSVKQMKADLGMSTTKIHYYLAQLEPILKRDESGKYYLTAEGRLLLDKYKGNYSEANTDFLEKLTRGNTAMLELRKYRELTRMIR